MNNSEKIYDLRRKEDISQEALAAIVGTTRQQVSRWECGSAVPNPKYSYALAAHFGCTVEELYGEKVEEEANPSDEDNEDEETAGGDPLETTDEINNETDEAINDDNTEGETE